MYKLSRARTEVILPAAVDAYIADDGEVGGAIIVIDKREETRGVPCSAQSSRY